MPIMSNRRFSISVSLPLTCSPKKSKPSTLHLATQSESAEFLAAAANISPIPQLIVASGKVHHSNGYKWQLFDPLDWTQIVHVIVVSLNFFYHPELIRQNRIATKTTIAVKWKPQPLRTCTLNGHQVLEYLSGVIDASNWLPPVSSLKMPFSFI